MRNKALYLRYNVNIPIPLVGVLRDIATHHRNPEGESRIAIIAVSQPGKALIV